MTGILSVFTALTLLLPASQMDVRGPAIPPTVEKGVHVEIVDDTGATFSGRVQDVSNDSVRLAIRGGTTDISVARIVRIERPDTVKNGALTGLGIGVMLGVAGSVSDPRVMVWRIAGNGVICAGIGALIDAAVNGRKTLYQRGPRPQAHLTPIVGRRSGGVAASIEW